MTITISNKRGIFDVLSEEGTLKLQGSASINDIDELRDFNASIMDADLFIGHVHYSEQDGKITKNIYCPIEKEALVTALLSGTIVDMKTNLAEETV